MPTFEEARQLILRNVTPVGIERVDILASLGRVIAEEIVSPRNMPQCDNSAMDGFAVRAADCESKDAELRVTGYIPAGGLPTGPVEPGCAIRIMTGAPVPPGADAVVPFEETAENNGAVRINSKVKARQHIRFTGEDVRCGETVLAPGTVVRPAEISMLASCGKLFVPVYRQLRVAILSTGDELVEVGEPVGPGKVVNSNALSLAAAVKEAGAIPIMLGIARDNLEEHREKIGEGLKADVFITSAGVSTGDRDFVRDVLEECGVKQVFNRIDIKPGGPTTFGLYEGKPVFSLPGNPVATMLMFEEFVRPALLRMMGHKRVLRPFVPAVLQHELKKKPGKVQLVRVRLDFQDGRAVACSAGDQNTGMLKTMLLANAVAVLPADGTTFAAGDVVDVQILSGDVDMVEA